MNLEKVIAGGVQTAMGELGGELGIKGLGDLLQEAMNLFDQLDLEELLRDNGQLPEDLMTALNSVP